MDGKVRTDPTYPAGFMGNKNTVITINDVPSSQMQCSDVCETIKIRLNLGVPAVWVL